MQQCISEMLNTLASYQSNQPVEKWKSPRKRWNVIRAFMANDEDHLIRIVNAMDLLKPNAKENNNTLFVTDAVYDFAIYLESSLFRSCDSGQQYTQGVVRLIHALMNNGEYIRQSSYTPGEIASMPPNALLANTMTDQIQRQMDMHEHRFKEMLQERFEELEKNSDSTEGLLQCGRCKSTNVIWEQRQTRSADEGMTIIAVCVKCSNKWRMT